ncbi:MAG TPA: MmgE/PrpD family protein [Rhizobium sp.]
MVSAYEVDAELMTTELQASADTNEVFETSIASSPQVETDKVGVTTRLAAQIGQLAASEIPDEAYDRAAVAVLDTLGVILAGSVTKTAERQRAAIVPYAGVGKASVFGTELRLNVLDATFLNTTAGHVLDYDDSNPRLHGHPSLAILPASLALAEETGSGIAEILKAYVIGFEVASRVGDAVGLFQYKYGWHPSATIGIFATIASAGFLLRLDETALANAFGLGASFASGIKANFGSDGKSIGLGHATRSAVQAVLLARQGVTAAPEAFEHKHGYLNIFNQGSGHYDLEALLGDWHGPLALLHNGLQQKRYPCCYSCLAPLDGVQAIAEQTGLQTQDIAAVDVRVHPIRHPHINRPNPRNGLEAKFSLQYCVARHLEAGFLSIDDFEDEAVTRPDTWDLMNRVHFGVHDLPEVATATVAITTTSGDLHEVTIPAALGSTDDRSLTLALLRSKFLDCSTRALDTSQAEALYQALVGLRGWNDLSPLRLAGTVAKGADNER